MTWLTRLLGLERPPAPRLVDLRNAIDALEARVEYLHAEHVKLRGRVTGGLRADPSPEDAPGRTIADRPARQLPPVRRNLRGF